jgi:hypothetical protein
MLKKRGALEISFGWLFAIIAGGVILFLAIYFSTKLIQTGTETVSAETGKEIGILLDPLETSFESAQTTSITIPAETRIDNGCELTGNFGEQIIRLDQKSFNKWIQTNVNVRFSNKYIFSNETIEGKKFYIFSKPFSFPFKIADLIYMTSSKDRYCFIDAPTEISEEIINLKQENLLAENCSGDEIKVCFNSGNCDINVDYFNGLVEKDGNVIYFDGDALMYGAIFSTQEVYECQLKRLMMRLKEISLLYQDKELIIANKKCEDNLRLDLNELGTLADSLTSSEELMIVKMKANDVEEKNNARRCLLW